MNKFKVGDWVRDKRNGMKNPIVQLKPDCIFLTNPEECGDIYELWQPKKDEWCWFYDKEFKTAILAKYISMYKTEVYTYFRSSYHIDNGLFLCCEPFIGELPSFLKEY